MMIVMNQSSGLSSRLKQPLLCSSVLHHKQANDVARRANRLTHGDISIY